LTSAKKKSTKTTEEAVENKSVASAEQSAEQATTASHGHDHTHEHGHDHEHDHEHTHSHTHTHTHGPVMNEACRRELKIEISAEEVTAATESVLRKYQKFARIPGFRPGKAPLGAVKVRFMDDARSEVVESLVSRHYRVAL